MAEEWKSYFCNVNGKLASIALDLGLREAAPMSDKSWLLWVWVYLQSPRADGLSDKTEFETLCAIEDELSSQLAASCRAVQAGRITTDGHREFYFYGTSERRFPSAVRVAMKRFRGYRFDLGSQHEPDWNQYLSVLYPTDENMQLLRNQYVLDLLMRRGDSLTPVRDVHHWIYFKSAQDREWYSNKARQLGYSIENETQDVKEGHPYGLTITRDQSVTPDRIDDAVIELFRLALKVDADYDGWEVRVISPDEPAQGLVRRTET